MKIPKHLKMRPDEPDIKDWCIVRYAKKPAMCCGPLGLNEATSSYLGFPGGQISPEILTFDTPEEVQDFLDNTPGRPPGASDIPELVEDQFFKIEIYNHYNSTSIIAYEGNDFLKARSAYFEQVGRKEITGNNYIKVNFKLREHE